MLLLLLSRFSHVQLCNPTDSSPPDSAVPGILRQEHWRELPFPSPMHESEKWKWSHSVVSDSSRPHGLQPTRFLRPWDLPGKSTGVGCYCLLWTKALVSAKTWGNHSWALCTVNPNSKDERAATHPVGFIHNGFATRLKGSRMTFHTIIR